MAYSPHVTPVNGDCTYRAMIEYATDICVTENCSITWIREDNFVLNLYCIKSFCFLGWQQRNRWERAAQLHIYRTIFTSFARFLLETLLVKTACKKAFIFSDSVNECGLKKTVSCQYAKLRNILFYCSIKNKIWRRDWILYIFVVCVELIDFCCAHVILEEFQSKHYILLNWTGEMFT